MFVNFHTITINDSNGSPVTVDLRLPVAAQLKLKRKWNEGSVTTLFDAIDDVERFVDVLDASLKWTGNQNTVKTGEELFELLADNDMLGMEAKQALVCSIGAVSGIISKDERDKILERTKKAVSGVLDEDEDGEAAGEAKNA